MRRHHVRAFAIIILLSFSPGAWAQADDVFDLTFGVRGGGGAEYLSAPSNHSKSFNDGSGGSFEPPFFDSERTGYNYALGFFAEARFFKYVGLEVGLEFSRHFLIEDVDWKYEQTINGNTSVFKAKSRNEVTWAGASIPIMIKGILPLNEARLWLGIGPEFYLTQWSTGDFDLKTEVGDHPAVAPHRQFKQLRSKTEHATYLTWALGVDVLAGNFNIPIVFKFGYSFDTPSDYYDRIKFDTIPTTSTSAYPTTATVRSGDSLYGQILVGFSFDVL